MAEKDIIEAVKTGKALAKTPAKKKRKKSRRKGISVGLMSMATYAAAIAEATEGEYLKNSITDRIRRTYHPLFAKAGIPVGFPQAIIMGVSAASMRTAANKMGVNPGIIIPGVITVRLL